MRAAEFTTALSSEPVLTVPGRSRPSPPKQGTARVIVLTPESAADADDAERRLAAYEQFMRDDASGKRFTTNP